MGSKLKRALASTALLSAMAGATLGMDNWYPLDYKEAPSGLKGHSYGRSRYRPTTASDIRHRNKAIATRRRKNKAAKRARKKK